MVFLKRQNEQNAQEFCVVQQLSKKEEMSLGMKKKKSRRKQLEEL